MKKLLGLLLLLLPFVVSLSQTSFSFEDYQNFIKSNSNLTSDELLKTNSAGEFLKSVNSNWSDAVYADSIEAKYKLTTDEKSLLQQNGFVVTERLGKWSFIATVGDIFHKDLPILVTTDMILHAFHRSYDKILTDVELTYLIPRLKTFLQKLIDEIPNLESKYNSDYMRARLKDVDLYLSVPLKLLDEQATPNYSENIEKIDSLIQSVNAEVFARMPFFSQTSRKIDFSQFKPRGHYDSSIHPELKKYFHAMMWLGRMELYLIAPDALVKPKLVEVQRQAIMANLILEIMEKGELKQELDKIEEVIEAFVGEQDNVTLSNINSLKKELEFSSLVELIDTNYFKSYQGLLAKQAYAGQKILSQVLIHKPGSLDEIVPASAFLLFGQRFVIDSYITGSVVFDKVFYPNVAKRMLPSTLDILFALGNNAAAQLLVSELDTYKYSPQLAGVRYLVDAYDNDFWNSTIYNGWLNSIRKLNPPIDRSNFPGFMQTAAWWQQKMNTQLGSWIELRHDNILYAKQSYTGGTTCSYPYGYVEPFPEFYSAIKNMALGFKERMTKLGLDDEYISSYFTNLSGVNDTLESIAQKELDGVVFTDSEKKFLKSVLTKRNFIGCGTIDYSGWYAKLFYDKEFTSEYLVADYHTSPTDAGGVFVGWVAHAGTGKTDLAIMNTKLPNGENVAFVGPVYSYHEYTTSNFLRLTDNEWVEKYIELSTRPEWTKLYLADKDGSKQRSSLNLTTDIVKDDNSPIIPETHIVAQNYPNPFNPSTVINFVVPARLTNKKVRLTIFNIKGEEVKVLVNEVLPTGNYLIEWNGTDSKNSAVTSGIYFYEVKISNERFVGKMNLVK